MWYFFQSCFATVTYFVNIQTISIFLFIHSLTLILFLNFFIKNFYSFFWTNPVFALFLLRAIFVWLLCCLYLIFFNCTLSLFLSKLKYYHPNPNLYFFYYLIYSIIVENEILISLLSVTILCLSCFAKNLIPQKLIFNSPSIHLRYSFWLDFTSMNFVFISFLALILSSCSFHTDLVFHLKVYIFFFSCEFHYSITLFSFTLLKSNF